MAFTELCCFFIVTVMAVVAGDYWNFEFFSFGGMIMMACWAITFWYFVGQNWNEARANRKLLSKILKELEIVINTQEEMVDWLENLIRDIKKQELVVNTAKTEAAVVTTASFIAMFTPLAPLASAGFTAAGIVSTATWIGDMIANKFKDDKLQERVQNMKKEESELQRLLDEFRGKIEKLTKKLHTTKFEDFLLNLPKVIEIGTEASKGIAKAGISAATELTKTIGGLTAGISIADAIHSWVSKSPNRKSAEELLSKIKKNLEMLKGMQNTIMKGT